MNYSNTVSLVNTFASLECQGLLQSFKVALFMGEFL